MKPLTLEEMINAVNGTVMVRNSKVVDGVFPGQPIRYPVEEKGRWVPLEIDDKLALAAPI